MNSTYAHRRPTKLPVDPTRIRHLPKQFAPIDRRLVYDRHLGQLPPPELALYVFLHCVGDAAGLSYYSDARIGEHLHLSEPEVCAARQGLSQRQFLLYRKPMYQLLDLPQLPAGPSAAESDHRSTEAHRDRRGREAVAIGTVLRELCAQGVGS